MKIKKINLKNFKGFAEKSFELNDHFTVFIGENASGKTSVLNALAVAAGSFFLVIDNVSSRPISQNEIRVITIDGQPRPQLPVCIEADGEIAGRQITWKREILIKNTTSKDANSLKKTAEQILAESRNPNAQSNASKVFPVIAYHSTCRLCAEHDKTDFQKQAEGSVTAYTNCLSPKSSSKEFLSWLKTQEDAVAKFDQDLDKILLKAFKETLLALVPDLRWTDVAFDRKTDKLTGIFVDNEGKKNKLSYNQLSDGFQNAVKLAADIAFRCIQLNPHLGERAVIDTPGIILIDEIDLHLHPNWQKRIINDLKRCFPNIQFAVTTHSPFIVQSLKSDELILLDVPAQDDYLENNPTNYSIEDISECKMNVKDVQRSLDFRKRIEIASKYYSLINQGKNSSTDVKTALLRQQLNELEEKFADDPTFIAHLKAERTINNL